MKYEDKVAAGMRGLGVAGKVVPAALLCLAWGTIAILFMAKGSGLIAKNVVLLVAAVSCAITVILWHRTEFGPPVWFEQR